VQGDQEMIKKVNQLSKKSIQLNTKLDAKSVPHGTIVIPELEPYRIAGRVYIGNGREWSEEEEAILQKYYGFAPANKIIKFLPGRTRSQLHSKVQRMGLSRRGK